MNPTIDLTIDYGEIALDSIIEDDLISEIPIVKTVATVYDPFNGASNPKSIPGAVLEYTLTSQNTGDGAADNNTIELTDIIPANTKLCVANTLNCLAPYFTDGSPTSGLSLSSTTYSNDGTTYYSSPSPDAEGANNAITHLRATMGGSFQPQTGASAPTFTLKFRVIVE